MSDMNFLIEEELSIIFLKEHKLNSQIKGYAFMMKWNLALQEFVKARLELEIEFEKIAVAVEKCDVAVEHLLK